MIRTSTAVLCCALVWLLLAVGRCEKYKRTFFLSFPAQDRGHMRRRKVWLLAGDFESSIQLAEETRSSCQCCDRH